MTVKMPTRDHISRHYPLGHELSRANRLRPMISSDRRATERRGILPSTTINLGAVLADERRARSDRRETPRRVSDMRTIAHFARRIGAGHTRLEVIVDGTDGLRLVAIFQCGCVAIEPVAPDRAAFAPSLHRTRRTRRYARPSPRQSLTAAEPQCPRDRLRRRQRRERDRARPARCDTRRRYRC